MVLALKGTNGNYFEGPTLRQNPNCGNLRQKLVRLGAAHCQNQPRANARALVWIVERLCCQLPFALDFIARTWDAQNQIGWQGQTPVGDNGRLMNLPPLATHAHGKLCLRTY